MNQVWNFFIDNFRLTYLLLTAVIIFGVFSIIQMPKESSPEVDIPVGIVTTALPGAPAQDVEELVTNPIETQIQGITNVETLTSQSATGFSQISVEFSTDSDTDESITELRDRVERATSELPSDATDPQVQKVSFSDLPILSFSISGPYDPADLKAYAEIIETESESVRNVSQANVIGAPTPIVKVALNQNRLGQYDLSPMQVTQAIQQANSDIPVGSITTGSGVYNLRFSGRLTTVDDVRSVPVTTANEAVVLLEDIADITQTFARQDVITRLSTNGNQPESAISVQIFKESGEGNILSITDTVNERIDNLRGNELPDELVIEQTQSDADLIRTDLNNLVTSGMVTMVIIFLVLLLFFGWREAVLASLSVPTTFLIAFIALNQLDFTINFLTLFSLILALGILVDAAIVVTEGITEALRRGADPTTAARETINEFARPLTAGTLTTVFVFFPMLLGSGIIGEFIKNIPATVTVVLLAALFVALGIITTLASRFFNSRSYKQPDHSRVSRAIDATYQWYGNFIDSLLHNRSRGKKFLLTVSALFVITLSLPFAGIVSLELFPQPDLDWVTINIEKPVGTPLSETSDAVTEIEKVLRADERITSFTSTIGSPINPGSLTTGSTNSHVAGIRVNLQEDRDVSSTEMVSILEDRLTDVVDGEVSVMQEGGGPPQGQPVQVQVIGDNLADLEQSAEVVADSLRNIAGTRNVESGVSDTGGDFILSVDALQARTYGVTPRQVAGVLQTAVSGVEAAVLKQDGDDTDVNVTYDIATDGSNIGALQADVSAIEGITIQTPRGGVPLSTFVDIRLGRGQSSISHEDTERVITITAATAEDANAQIIANTLIDRYQSGELDLPEGISLSFGGEAQEIQESFTDLFVSMIIGILLIFALLVWQFKSFRTPFIMLSTIPLAFVGVFAGLAITFQPLSFPAFIGVVALAGIVVNNAIILIDRINLNKDEGEKHTYAIKHAAQSRLQPILLTTITTIGGMIPLIFADPSWAPLAYSVIFGLLFSTVLTLVVIPLLYQRFEA